MNKPKSNPEWDRLLSAAQKNNTIAIHRFVRDGVDPNHANYVGQSSLHIASLWGNVEALRALLSYDKQIKLNGQNTIMGSTPLHSSVQSAKKPSLNRVECARLLIEAGADVYIKDLNDNTPLQALELSVEKDPEVSSDPEYVEEMRRVLQAGGMETLILIPFIKNLDLDGLKSKLNESETDADVNELEKTSGMSTLMVAVNKLSDIFEDNYDMDSIDETKIERLTNIILFLIEKGVNVNLIPEKKVSAINKKEKLTAMYITSKILFDLNANGTESDKVSSFKARIKSILISLKKHGAQSSSSIVNLIHDGVRRGHLDTVEFWIEKVGIDPNTKGRQGLTLLHFASRSGKIDIVQWLLSFQGNVDAGIPAVDLSVVDDRGKTALDAAVANNKEDIVSLLKNASSK